MNNNNPADSALLDWFEANPEAIRVISVNKSWGRKVWWCGPGGNDYHTLRDCLVAAFKEYPMEGYEKDKYDKDEIARGRYLDNE